MENVDKIPTLEELLQKWRGASADILSAANYFALVAGGQRGSMLRGNNAIFAAQTVMVLINHFLELEKKNDATKTTTTEESNNCQGQGNIIDPTA